MSRPPNPCRRSADGRDTPGHDEEAMDQVAKSFSVRFLILLAMGPEPVRSDGMDLGFALPEAQRTARFDKSPGIRGALQRDDAFVHFGQPGLFEQWLRALGIADELGMGIGVVDEIPRGRLLRE